MEFTLYCDESTDKGKIYGDFFGGCIIEAHHLDYVITSLQNYKFNHNLFAELKWTKVTEKYLDKYLGFMHLFFSFVASDFIKVRIMFRKMKSQNTSYSSEDKYFKLYYQFIKHAFGFCHTQNMPPFNLRIYLDQLPQKKDKIIKFKKYLVEMPHTRDFENCAMRISPEQIAEIKSHEHVLLQCVDVIMGAMQFKLNKLYEEKNSETSRRGKRTIAKEKLYRAIYKEICSIHPHFNINISTGHRKYENPHWESPYEHWLFKPNEYVSYSDIWIKHFADKKTEQNS